MLTIIIRFRPIYDISNVCSHATYTKWFKILMKRDTTKYLISSLNSFHYAMKQVKEWEAPSGTVGY